MTKDWCNLLFMEEDKNFNPDLSFGERFVSVSKFEKSAIIGYYRSGAPNSEIAFLMNLSISRIEKIIQDYLGRLPSNSKWKSLWL